MSAKYWKLSQSQLGQTHESQDQKPNWKDLEDSECLAGTDPNPGGQKAQTLQLPRERTCCKCDGSVATGKEQTGRVIQVCSLRSSARFPARVGRNRKQRPNRQSSLSAKDSNQVESERQEVKSKEAGPCQHVVAERRQVSMKPPRATTGFQQRSEIEITCLAPHIQDGNWCVCVYVCVLQQISEKHKNSQPGEKSMDASLRSKVGWTL